MAKAYSDDLRRKLIEAHQQGEGSLEVLARRFHVSVGWARKVSATYRRSGSWARPPSGRRGPRSKFTGEIRRQVGEWIAEQPDLTLHELQSRLHEELRLRASIGRLWSLLREMGLRLKKTLYAAELLYLPPCSPDFNPIEACWGRSGNNCAAPRPARWPRSKHALPTPSLP